METYTPGFFSTILLLAKRIEVSAANLFDVLKDGCRLGQAVSAAYGGLIRCGR
jgi:hypothetical protein